jgi:hypothetical protein
MSKDMHILRNRGRHATADRVRPATAAAMARKPARIDVVLLLQSRWILIPAGAVGCMVAASAPRDV